MPLVERASHAQRTLVFNHRFVMLLFFPPPTSSSSFLACNSYNCVVPYVDIILHRGRFWAKSAASGSVKRCCFRSCWTVPTAEVIWSFYLSVCLSVSRITEKSNESVSLNLMLLLDLPIGRTNFWWGCGPTKTYSVFHFPHHCGIGDFRRFIGISHTVTGQFLRNLAKWPTPAIHNILGEIWQTSGPGSIQQSGFESQITFGWNFGVGGGLCSPSCCFVFLVVRYIRSWV